MEDQPVQNPTPEPTLTPAQVPEPKTRFPVIPVLLVILLLLLGSTAFLYYQNMQLKNMLANYQTPAASPIPSATADPTAGWKTYTNTSKHYTFKYPGEAVLDESQKGLTKVTFMGPKQIASGRIQTELFDGYSFVVADISADGSTLEEILQKRVESFKTVCDAKDLGTPTATTVDEESAITYSWKCLGNYTTYLVANRSNFFEINELYVGETNDQSNYKRITDQILSTLKFTQ